MSWPIAQGRDGRCSRGVVVEEKKKGEEEEEGAESSRESRGREVELLQFEVKDDVQGRWRL